MDEPRGKGEPPIHRIVRCPGCGGDSVYDASNPYRPFCGERCRNADLGAWASEGYRVPAPPSGQDRDDSELPDT
ncbi:MAG: DNA gyrase inhibitor YacG [Caldimonas sp.]